MIEIIGYDDSYLENKDNYELYHAVQRNIMLVFI